ncbi:MAG: hypothetical protein IJ933_06055 [Bacteroidales bacterium]|nr:hypothetical protein [Bacteroidales bacterium]
MDNRKIVKEATLYSIEGDKGHTSIVEYANGNTTTLQQDFNNVATSSQQDCNNVATSLQQDCNSVATSSQQDCKAAQTQAARDAKDDQPAITPHLVVKNNDAVVRLLNDKRFISQNVDNGYLMHFFSVPKPFVAAINRRLRTNYSMETIAKIRIANEYLKRVPKYKVYAISITICIATVFLTNAYHRIFTPSASPSDVPSVQSSLYDDHAPITPDDHAAILDAAIAEYEAATGKRIYPAGRRCLEKASAGMNKTQIIELINRNVK